MNEQDQEVFNRIVGILPENLTSEDIDFLYARRSYLNREQSKAYADVIKAKDAAVAEQAKEE